MNKLLLTTTLGLLLAASLTQAAPAIIPAPAKLEAREGVFTFTAKTGISCDKSSRATAEFLAEKLRAATGLRLKVSSGQPQAGDILITTTGQADATLGDEGYTLSVTSAGVAIYAPKPAGAFYGVQSLLQLLPPEVFAAEKVSGVKWEIPSVEITDAPRFPWRGLLVDVARHFLTIEELKQFVDVMAVHKLNTLHLHLTDDQGWRLEIKKYPLLTKLGSVRAESPAPGNRDKGDGTPYGPFFYTQKQMRDLVAYAQARHITIVPEIEMPGHLLGVLTAYPELSCTGGPFKVRTQWGVEEDVLCVGNPKGLEFMKNVLAETLELFPSKFIHIGGDEVPRTRWQHCAKCQALMKTEGLTKEAQLQTWFNHHIETYLAGKGRRMIGWDEILEGGLTPGAAVMSWRGVQGGIEAAEAGHDAVMSPGSHLYFDHGQAKGPNEPEVIGGYTTINKTYAYEPVPAQLPQDKAKHILGVQGNLWSEYYYEPTFKRIQYQAYPRACALAEVDWSPRDARNFDDFYRRLQIHVKRLHVLNVNYRRLDAATVDLKDK